MTPSSPAPSRPSPRLPRDSRSQAAGRRGEAVVTERYEGHGWIVMRNRPSPDFGIDLAAFKRSEDRFVLPYAVSIQVKTVERAHQAQEGGVSVRVRSSTLASWLWSNTPTVCILYESSTGRMWWSSPVASPSTSFDRSAKSRTLRIDAALDSEADWLRLDATVAELWNHHAGAGAIMDVPLVLQLLTDIALDTDLWTTAGDSADSAYHAAAVHSYRTIAALNGVAGRTGSDDFVALAEAAADQVGVSWSQRLVSRGGTRLGVVSGIELRPWSTFLLEVFGQSGRELAASVPRLQRLARMPELGVPADVCSMLTRITGHQLEIIDPDRAKNLAIDDFAQIADRPDNEFPSIPELDNQVPRPLARVMAHGLNRRPLAPLPSQE